METSQSPLEAALAASGRIFTEPIMFTATLKVVLSGDFKGWTLEEITHFLGQILEKGAGPAKVLNSNFGHYCQPGYEKFLKDPNAAKKPRRQRNVNDMTPEEKMMIPVLTKVTRKQRKPQGDGTCLSSSLEIIIFPDSDIPEAVADIQAERPAKFYKTKFFPASGEFQVFGVLDDNYADGFYAAEIWAKFLTAAGAAADPETPIAVTTHKLRLINYKWRPVCANARLLLNLVKLPAYLENAKALEPPSPEAPPFPIREVNYSRDSQKVSFKFVCPSVDEAGKATTKKVTIKIFRSGKVNILGADDKENPLAIYRYFETIFSHNRSRFFKLKPLPDNAVEGVAREAGEAERERFDYLTNEELDDVLASLDIGSPSPPEEPRAAERESAHDLTISSGKAEESDDDLAMLGHVSDLE